MTVPGSQWNNCSACYLISASHELSRLEEVIDATWIFKKESHCPWVLKDFFTRPPLTLTGDEMAS